MALHRLSSRPRLGASGSSRRGEPARASQQVQELKRAQRATPDEIALLASGLLSRN